VKRRVAVLTGCPQDLVFADVNRATVNVLLANEDGIVWSLSPVKMPGHLYLHIRIQKKERGKLCSLSVPFLRLTYENGAREGTRKLGGCYTAVFCKCLN
jgi:hypothetical protein